jgi:transcriptional regulator with XRE-family HTH domain
MKQVILKLNIKPLMDKRGLTQEGLEDATGIPQGTISRWVNNRVDNYKKDILEKLMAYFDCDLADLFTIEVVEKGKSKQ